MYTGVVIQYLRFTCDGCGSITEVEAIKTKGKWVPNEPVEGYHGETTFHGPHGGGGIAKFFACSDKCAGPAITGAYAKMLEAEWPNV